MSQALNTSEITDQLQHLPGWSLTDKGDAIRKTYPFTNFKEAMSFLVRVAFEAEAMNHHPHIENVYRTVTLTLNTHDVGGKVTMKDIDMANAIEKFNWLR